MVPTQGPRGPSLRAPQTQTVQSPQPSRIRCAAANAAAFSGAALIIWWLARGIPFARFSSDLRQARLALFIPAAFASLAFWIAGDTLVYARLFSCFHVPTRFREMLPGTLTHEFLQVVNGIAAGTSLAWFVQARKGVDWLAAACTLGLLGFVDLQLMAWMLLVASGFEPPAALVIPWYYPALFIGGSCAFAVFWLRGHPGSRLGQWIYQRPFFTAFRQARLTDYVTLGLIRLPFFALQGIVLYVEMIAFGLRVPLAFVMAMLPVVLIASAFPWAPSGLGTRQAAIVIGFEQFGSRSSLLTMSLAHSWLVIVARLAFGMLIGGAVLRNLMRGPAAMRPPLTINQTRG
jgi:hypothetical protein